MLELFLLIMSYYTFMWVGFHIFNFGVSFIGQFTIAIIFIVLGAFICLIATSWIVYILKTSICYKFNIKRHKKLKYKNIR